MKIAVNTRLLIGNKLDGIGIFTRETLRRIVQSHPEHQFLFLFDRPWSADYIFADNVKPVIVPPRVREPATCLLWQELQLPALLRRKKADLFFSPEPMHSLRADLPKIEVIHDLNYEHQPDALPFIWRSYYQIFSKRYARNATRLVTVSDFSKRDIVDTYGIPEDRIDVVYNGAPQEQIRLSDQEKEAVRAMYTSGSPYFYFVGTLHQRKNIAGMLRAFGEFKQRNDNNIKLVIVGRRKWWTGEMEKALEELPDKDAVHFVGRLEDKELARVAASSLGLLYIPFFEGFGIPILEAFAAHVPVITSNTTSMPEVAGEGGLLVNPHSSMEIVRALEQIANDTALRSRLIEQGGIQHTKYSWDRTAGLLWDSFSRVLEGRK